MGCLKRRYSVIRFNVDRVIDFNFIQYFFSLFGLTQIHRDKNSLSFVYKKFLD